MNEPIAKRGIIVGVFIILGLAFLLGGVLAIGNLHSTFQSKMIVSTVFNDVNGLQSGNNIWFSGVKIGAVKKTEFYGKSQVNVVMNINEESKQYIRKDAKVKVSTDGLIGNKILVIYGGTAAAGEIEEGDTLSNETLLSAENLMSTLQQNNLNILKLTDRLSKGEGTLGKLLNSDSLYSQLMSTSFNLKLASANAGLLIGSFSEFGKKLNKKGTLINDLVSDSVTYTGLKNSVFKLSSLADTAAVFINSIKVATNNSKSPYGVLFKDEEAGAGFKSTLLNLESSSKKLDEDLEALQHSFLLRRYFRKKANTAKPVNSGK